MFLRLVVVTSLAQENGTLSDSDRFLLPSVRVLLFISVQVSSSRSVRDSFVQSRREVRGRERESGGGRSEGARAHHIFTPALLYISCTLWLPNGVCRMRRWLWKRIFSSLSLSLPRYSDSSTLLFAVPVRASDIYYYYSPLLTPVLIPFIISFHSTYSSLYHPFPSMAEGRRRR